MDFEWDPAKDAINFEKHGVDFDYAIGIFESFTLECEDDRRDYGETRLQVIGETAGHILLVVLTVRGSRLRIISARKARQDERRRYFEALGQALPDGSQSS
ncbi:BrnT family toxin [Aurantimonas coralicida]|uniref:BrnT family toxin n=1 Tax=Aurantimonas coralicida TaxID=182270 RepID=UPI001E2A41CD|nr:BrnT family toxin [Aurantimonas coralicida]MCD1644350.1 BrnT family toxin [Aurantimonas coralicida]